MNECAGCGRVEEDEVSRCPEDGLNLLPGLPGPPLLDGRYLLRRLVGAGGMGSVYEARHAVLDRIVAVKLLHPRFGNDEVLLARLRSEARALGLLRHPGIVDVLEFGIEVLGRGIPYLVIEYLEGETLAARVARQGGLPPEQALPILRAVSAAIDEAHRHGILHRDLKPSNVFLCRPDSEDAPAASPVPGETVRMPIVKVLDFGMAHFEPSPGAGMAVEAERDVRLTLEGRVVGTPRYLAPELTWGDPATPASDVYSFGVLAYEVLVGRPPYSAENVEDLLLAHSVEEPRPPSEVRRGLPSEMDAVLLAALEKEPEDRPATAAAVVDAIEDAYLAHQAAVRAQVENEERRQLLPGRLVRAALGGLVAAVVAALVGFVPLARVGGDRLAILLTRLQAPRAPHPQLVVVAIDEATLAADPAPLGAQADLMGRSVDALFLAGASGVAIDLLLPASWGASRPFVESVTRHASRLTLASWITPEGSLLGPECLGPAGVALLGEEHAESLFGLANLHVSRSGVVLRGHRAFEGRSRSRRLSWAGRVLERAGVREGPESTLIDYRVPVERLDRISYRDLQGILEGRPERVRGKLVLLGATYAGSGDTHADPAGGKRLSGLEVQTLILHSFLSGSVPELGFPAILAGALALSLAGAALATIVVRSRPGLLAATAVASLGGLGAGAGLFLSTSLLPPFLAWSLAPALGALLGHRLGILPARGRRRRP